MNQVVARELYLEDFKSFGTKTRIPLRTGFTTISGPNGSGKSNLLDALLFVLGLSSSKQLRAERLPDLINNQKGKKQARVALKISVPEDGGKTERLVEVARQVRLTKSGYVSNYYLDGRTTTLAEVHDVLNRIGIGSQGGNVVLQGDVTRIITMSPLERRRLIDELAGVAEFDRKIEQALGEMQVAERHMEDCNLISSELKLRLEGLAEERAQALKHQELQTQRDSWELQLLFAEAREMDRKAEGFRNDALDQKETLEKAKADLPRMDQRIEAGRTELREAEENLRRLGEGEKLEKLRQLEELKAKSSNLRSEIAHAEGLVREGGRRSRSLKAGMERAQTEKAEHHERAESLRAEAAISSQEEAEARKAAEAAKSELGRTESASREKVERLHELKDQGREVRVELEGVKAKAEHSKVQRDRVQGRLETIDQELQGLAGKLKGLHELVEDADTTKSDLVRRGQDSQELVSALKRRQRELADRKVDLEEEIRPLIRQIGAAEASKQLDNTGKVLSMLRSAGIPGVIGDAGSLVQYSNDLALAVQAGGGGRLKHILVQDDRVASRCIEFLRSRKGPRTTFLPLNKIRGQSVTRFVQGQGLVDHLINLVEFDEEYLPAFEYVFGTTVVAEDIHAARPHLGKFRMVTMDGDTLETSGAMSGGGNQKARARGGNLQGLRAKLQNLEGEVRRVLDELRSIDKRLSDAEETRDRARETLARLDRDLARDQKDREGLLDRRLQLKKQRDELDQERQEAQKLLETLASKEGELSGRLQGLTKKIEGLESELAGGHAAQLAKEVETQTAKAQSARELAQSLEEEAKRKELEASYLVRRCEEWQRELEEVTAKGQKMEEKVRESRKKAAQLEEEIQVLAEELEGLSAELEALRKVREECSSKLEALFQRRAKLEAKVTVIQEQLLGLEKKVAELEEVREGFQRQLEEKGGLPQGVSPETVPPLSKVRREHERVQRALQDLGPVNLLAVEQYEKLDARRVELEERLQKLTDEKNDLQARIDRFGDLKKEAFLQSFHEVDKHFREIYAELSEGAGHLELENEEDPFAGGMTLRAQPRHKVMERLEALSGGEKSLAALAFIFSLQGVRPAPFYVFDEVDSFLDGRNTERLADMIQRRAEGTQFLVVSHRKAMLKRSQRTVGVTPGPGGNTRVTGLEYSDHEKASNS